MALGSEMPAIAGPAGAIVGGAGSHESVLLQAAQMAAHHLHRHPEATGEVRGGGFAFT